MSGGTIHGNTGDIAGGVYFSGPRNFTKTGGIIYGKAGDRSLDNEAVGNTQKKGHAVFWDRTYNGFYDNFRRINGDIGGNLSAEGSDLGWDPQLLGVTVTSPVISAEQGATVQLSATVEWNESGSQEVTWQLDGSAGGSSISADGLLSVGANETATTLTVRAVSVATGASGSKAIFVVPPVVARTQAGLYIGAASSPVDGTASLATALAYLKTHEEPNTNYTIVLGEDTTVSTAIDLTASSIILEGLGTERTIRRDNAGYIFNVGNGRTLTLGNNITLKGRTRGVDGADSDNTDSVVLVNGGKLVMLDGSKITGNTATTSINMLKGAGVTLGSIVNGEVYTGAFEMRGGEISGNTITTKRTGAGAVCVVANSTFVMSGGLIRGNTANSIGAHAGGVVSDGGIFEKTGGVIYGVNPDRAGYDAADDNTATGTSAYKANAIGLSDSSGGHSFDGDLADNFPVE
jgi:hypothetical protein